MRAAIVGAGLMGRWHAEALKRSGGQVVACVDSDLRAAEMLASRHSGAGVFTQFQAMLAQTAVDVVHICTPTVTHVPLAEEAIRAGCHVLVEKPLASTSRQTQDLLEFAAEQDRLLCPVFQFAFQAGVRKAHRLLPEAGDLIQMNFTIRSAGGMGQSDPEIDRIASEILAHPFSLLQVFLPGKLSDIEWMTIHPSTGELQALGQSGKTGLSINMSMAGRPTRNDCKLVGSQATIHINLFHGYSFIESGTVSRARKILQPFDYALRQTSAGVANLMRRAIRREFAYPGLRELIGSFYAAIRGKDDPPITPAATLDVALATETLLRNASRTAHPISSS